MITFCLCSNFYGQESNKKLQQNDKNIKKNSNTISKKNQLPQPSKKAKWITNWNDYTKKKNKLFPKDWVLKGTKWGVPSTSFYIQKDPQWKQNVLVVDADKSTSTIIYDLSDKVDLKKTPIMRWCWKAQELPAKADGRVKGKDDQVLGIYIGTGRIKQKSIAYRWETETPKGHIGKISYGGGFVTVKWFCVNNKEDKIQKWVTVERNIADDYKKAYGFIPNDFAITIAGNSQYTESHGVGMVAFIEFIEKPTVKTAVKNTEKVVSKKKSSKL